MKWVDPTIRTRSRSISTTPGTVLIAASAFSETPSGARSSRVSTVERVSRRPSRPIITATPIAAAASPHQIAEAGQDEADDDGERAEHVGGKMQRIGGQRLALGVARGAMQRPRAPEIHDDVDHQHDEGDRRDGRRRRAFAQAAPGFDQNAAGQHIEQGDDAERRQALELAVAVMMLVVRRLVGNPHHRPGDDGGDQVDRAVQRFGDQRQLPMEMPTANFAAAIAALAKIEIAATRDLML